MEKGFYGRGTKGDDYLNQPASLRVVLNQQDRCANLRLARVVTLCRLKRRGSLSSSSPPKHPQDSPVFSVHTCEILTSL